MIYMGKKSNVYHFRKLYARLVMKELKGNFLGYDSSFIEQ